MSNDDQGIDFGEVRPWNPQRCPKCRTALTGPQGPCAKCGWSSLRDSELVFLDSNYPCPKCGRSRDPNEELCSTCGASPLRESHHGSSYTISALLLVTTLFATCFAISVPLPGLGIPISVFVLLAAVRTNLLTRRRKQHGYPITNEIRFSFFAQSIGAMLLAGLCGVAVCFVAAGCLLSSLSVPPSRTLSGVAIAVCTLITIPIVAVGLTRREPHHGAAGFAALAAQMIALPVFWIRMNWVPNPYAVFPILNLIGLGGSLTLAIWYLCYDGRKRTVATVVASGYVAFALSGLISIAFNSDLDRAAMGMIAGLVGGLALSAVAAILTALWSYDDAFAQ